MKNRTLLIITALLMFASCNQNNSQEIHKQNKNTNIANGPGININISQVEHYLIKLPLNERWKINNTKVWLKNVIKNLYIDKLKYQNALKTNIFLSSEYLQNSRAIDRIIYSNQYINQLDNKSVFSEKELLNYYQTNITKYQYPEQRVVYHIYKKVAAKEKTTLKNMHTIRDRLLNGESFKILALKYSESETRHNDSYLGMFKKNQKPIELNNIIFSLNRHIPSLPIKLGSGYHIFYVEEIIKQRNFKFSEVKQSINKKLSEEAQFSLLEKEAINLLKSKQLTIVDENQLSEIKIKNKQFNTLLQVGDFSLTYRQLLNDLYINTNHSKYLSPDEVTTDLLKDIAYREILYQSMVRSNSKNLNTDLSIELKKRLTLKLYEKLELYEYLNNHPELINDFFKKNNKRFYSSLLLGLSLYKLPINKKLNLMPELELATKQLNSGKIKFEDLKNKHGGELLDYGLLKFENLKREFPQALSFALKLKVGDHSPPFTVDSTYYVLKLDKQINPKLQSIDNVNEIVFEEYLDLNRSKLLYSINIPLIEQLNYNESNIDQFIINPILFD